MARLSVAVLLLAVVGLLTRRRGEDTRVPSLPASSLAIACFLLAVVPSKWTWHFGALIGLGAVALSAESTRLLRMGRSAAATGRAVGALVLGVVTTLWAWTEHSRWESSTKRTGRSRSTTLRGHWPWSPL